MLSHTRQSGETMTSVSAGHIDYCMEKDYQPKPVRVDTHARNTIVLGLTQSYFEHGVLAQTGLGYQSFYIQ